MTVCDIIWKEGGGGDKFYGRKSHVKSSYNNIINCFMFYNWYDRYTEVRNNWSALFGAGLAGRITQ